MNDNYTNYPAIVALAKKFASGGSSGSGEDGATFIPAVSQDGIISWTNNKGLANPNPVNIKGPEGKSAFEFVKENGYTGTEEELAAKLIEDYIPINQGIDNAGKFLGVSSEGKVIPIDYIIVEDEIGELSIVQKETFTQKLDELTLRISTLEEELKNVK